MERISFTLVFEVLYYSDPSVVCVIECLNKQFNRYITKNPEYTRTYLETLTNSKITP